MDFNQQNLRVIVLIDMDCFYVQVEQKFQPEFKNKPCAVVQYNTWKGGGIIAVNYEARAFGVTRGMRGDEAQKKCPDIHLFKVPEERGKADLTRYREASASVLKVLCEFCDCIERASIDEAYLDLTSYVKEKMEKAPLLTLQNLKNTFVIGWEKDDDNAEKWLQTIYEEDYYADKMLSLGASYVEEMRAAVFQNTGFICSAGIAHNKMLAKLACGIHKPNKQTIVPQSSIPLLYSSVPVAKIRNLGGKLGEAVMKKFNVKIMADLLNISEKEFITNFGEKIGSWLYNVSRGIENEPVVARQLPKSIGCGKNFPGKQALNTKNKVDHWIKQLTSELEERLIRDQNDNHRMARAMTITIRNRENDTFATISRTCPIYVYNTVKLAHDALSVLQKLNTASSDSDLWKPPIYSMAICASKFQDRIECGTNNIQTYFSPTKNNPAFNFIKEANATLSETNATINLKDNSLNNSSISSIGTTKTKISSIANFFSLKDNSPGPSNCNSNYQTCEEANIQNGNNFDEKKNKISSIDNFSPLKDIPPGPSNSNSDFQTCEDVNIQSKNSLSDKEKQNNMKEKNDTIHSLFHNEASLSTIDDDSESDIFSKENSSGGNQQLNNNLQFSIPTNEELDPELKKNCEICDKTYPIWEEQEHLDYHLAVDLSKKIPVATAPLKFPVNKSKKVIKKRGKFSKKGIQAKKSMMQINTLDSFLISSKKKD